METDSVVNMLPVALLAVAALALIGWLVYRNIRDEGKYEEDMDNPKRTIKHEDEENV